MLRWLKKIAELSFVESIVLTINFFSSLLIIRILSPKDFAIYALAMSGFNLLNSLSNLGIIQAVTAIGGEIWEDRHKLGKVISAGLKARNSLLKLVIFVVFPIQVGLIYKHTQSSFDAFIFFILIVPESYCVLSSEFYFIGARLHGSYRIIQKTALIESISRLILNSTGLFFFINAIHAYFFRLFAGIIRFRIAKRESLVFFEITENTDKMVEERIQNSIKHVLPNSIYLNLQSQIMVWLISIFGQTSQIAHLSALGKISGIFSIFGSLMSNLILPKFSIMRDPVHFLRKVIVFFGLLSSAIATAIFLSSVYPERILWILGKNYIGLESELLLSIYNSLFSLFIGCIWGMNYSRNWIKYSWLYIPFVLVTQAFLLYYLPLNTVKGVFIFNLISQVPALLIGVALFGLNYRVFYRNFEEFQNHRV